MCLGVTDLPLGPEGLAQAAEMAASLPPVTAVFSSPLSRAMEARVRRFGLKGRYKSSTSAKVAAAEMD